MFSHARKQLLLSSAAPAVCCDCSVTVFGCWVGVMQKHVVPHAVTQLLKDILNYGRLSSKFRVFVCLTVPSDLLSDLLPYLIFL